MKKRFILSLGLSFLMMLTNITGCSAAEDASQKSEKEVFEAAQSGIIFTIPDEFSNVKGTIKYSDLGDDNNRGIPIVAMLATYTPLDEKEYEARIEQGMAAQADGDIETTVNIILGMHSQRFFEIFGLKDGGIDQLKEHLLEQIEARGLEDELSQDEINQNKEEALAEIYTELGQKDGFTYILTTPDPEKIKKEGLPEGFDDDHFEEYISLLENVNLIIDNIELVGDVELHDPVAMAEPGTSIHFETEDLDGNIVKSEDLFKGHKVTMINMWGTWCDPCKRELPKLEELNKELAAKDCQIIGIVTDADEEEIIADAKEILEDKEVTYINLLPFDEMSTLLPQPAWPTSYFVDENGVVVGEAVIGAEIDQYSKRIDQILESLNQ